MGIFNQVFQNPVSNLQLLISHAFALSCSQSSPRTNARKQRATTHVAAPQADLVVICPYWGWLNLMKGNSCSNADSSQDNFVRSGDGYCPTLNEMLDRKLFAEM